MTKYHEIAVLVVAAGSGQRAGGGIPKQFRPIGGMPVLARTLKAFCDFGFKSIIPVIGDQQDAAFYQAIQFLTAEQRAQISAPVIGGASRQQSVLQGLKALQASQPQYVLIHDGARAFTPASLIEGVAAALNQHTGVIPALAIIDTVKQVTPSGQIVSTLDRATLRTVQTPQGFKYQTILAAHQAATDHNIQNLTDDASVAEWAGQQVFVIDGAPENIKITTPEDFAAAERMILRSLDDIRVGQGYDVHSFEPGDHIWLGGIKIPHSAKLNGHSDSDVLLHAITDAILGALGDGDIGVHFPPSQEKWRGVASKIFLADAVARVHTRGGMIAHLDGTLVCEAPKIGPHREAMRAEIASIAGIALDRVGLKATTSEKLGFVGRGEGIVAYATATVRLP